MTDEIELGNLRITAEGPKANEAVADTLRDLTADELDGEPIRRVVAYVDTGEPETNVWVERIDHENNVRRTVDTDETEDDGDETETETEAAGIAVEDSTPVGDGSDDQQVTLTLTPLPRSVPTRKLPTRTVKGGRNVSEHPMPTFDETTKERRRRRDESEWGFPKGPDVKTHSSADSRYQVIAALIGGAGEPSTGNEVAEYLYDYQQASPILHDLYKYGFLNRTSRSDGTPGGWQYEYWLTEKGKEYVKQNNVEPAIWKASELEAFQSIGTDEGDDDGN